MSSRVDTGELIGRRFGSLVIVEFLEEYSVGKKQKRYNHKYLCKCDCGDETVRDRISLLNSRRKGYHNRCLACMKRDLKENPRGVKYDNDMDRNIGVVYSNYRSKCKSKGLQFDMTQQEFSEMVQSNCFYCNLPPSNLREAASKRQGFSAKHLSGIDRIDNSGGYTKGNVRPCCEDCNKAKRDLTEGDFLDMIRNIYENLNLGG